MVFDDSISNQYSGRLAWNSKQFVLSQMLRELRSIVLSLLFGYIKFLVVLFAFSTLFADTVEYRGISFECPKTCGIPYKDPLADEICETLLESTGHIFDGCGLPNRNGAWKYLPEEFRPQLIDEDLDCSSLKITRYFWENTNGKLITPYEEDYYELELLDWQSFPFTFNGALSAIGCLQKDLNYYEYEKSQYRRQKAELHQRNLDLLRPHDSGRVFYNKDTGEVESICDVLRSFYSSEYSLLLDQAIKQEEEGIQDCLQSIARDTRFEQAKQALAEAIIKIDNLFEQIFLRCLRHHQPEGIAYEATLESLLEDDYFSAIRSLRKLCRLAESQGFQDEILSKIHLLSGQLYSEFGRHAEAIESLTTAIAKDPLQKEAFLERAISHFELGQFDLSIEDYLHFDNQSPQTIDASFVDFCEGCISGIIEKGQESLVQFLPEAIGSLNGISQGLWALCTNPIGVSQDFAISAKECIHFIRTHATSTMVQEMVPELQDLIRSYLTLSDQAQGRLIGEMVGKYGVDILFTGGIISTVKACKNLKRANAIMTLEALSAPSGKSVILKEATKRSAKRADTLKAASKKIHDGQQGKHIVGHNNYVLDGTKSIFDHTDPQGLCDKFAGTGIKANSGVPGMAGYKELVNFKESIGKHVDRRTKVQTPTTWGIVHYGNKGVHIVPTLPPGE